MKKAILLIVAMVIVAAGVAIAETTYDEWYQQEIVDEFGDVTETVWQYITTGTFSNSATSNSNLQVIIRYRDEDCRLYFSLYEYDWGRPSADLESGSIRIKNSEGEILSGSIEWGCLETDTPFDYPELKKSAERGLLILDAFKVTNNAVPIRITSDRSHYAFSIKGIQAIAGEQQ